MLGATELRGTEPWLTKTEVRFLLGIVLILVGLLAFVMALWSLVQSGNSSVPGQSPVPLEEPGRLFAWTLGGLVWFTVAAVLLSRIPPDEGHAHVAEP